jgi:hypothetical protein
MGLKLTTFAFVSLSFLGMGKVAAKDQSDNYYVIGSREVKELSASTLTPEAFEQIRYQGFEISDLTSKYRNPDPIERTGKIISVGRDLVALGEDIYRLVIKGKPTNTTKYAPVSVVPKVNGEAVDLLETEGWQIPVKRTYQILYKNLYGMEVVKFSYSLIYSFGGSYGGRGAYLTSVQIIPESVSTLFGYDFTATMKLGGIQNQGTRDNPIAGSTILLEYTVNTVVKASTEVDSFFITGRGGFRKL